MRAFAVSTLLAVACCAALPWQAQGTDFELTPCHIDNYPLEVQCGSYTVYENRELASGREITVHFAVLAAVDGSAAPDPLVIFAGGPGQSAISMAPFVRSAFRTLNERRDVVLIDQRGMGSSHPLRCDTPDDDDILGLTPEAQDALSRELLTDCLASLDADVTLYTQEVANQDIHDILLGLGYQRVNVYGASWGTRSALLFAHRYPEQVRSMILDGALPVGNIAPLHAGTDADRALQLLFDDCAADADCAAAFPDLAGDFDLAMQRLGDEGVRVESMHPSRGEMRSVLWTRQRFGDALRSILYIPSLSRLIPWIVQRVSVGDYRALDGVFGFLSTAMAEGMTVGASLTIFCSEELQRMGPSASLSLSPSLPEAEASRQRLGRGILANLQNACGVWPKAPVPAIYGETVTSEAPTLILSGEVDPITPPAWGEVMAEALPRSQHLVAKATGHNVAPRGCAPELILEWIDRPWDSGGADLAADLDGSCLDSQVRPSFFVSPSGPSMVRHEEEGR